MPWAGSGGLADRAVVATRNRFGSGRTVSYTPVGGSAVSITAVFDEAAEVWVTDGDGVDVQGVAPVLDVRLEDMPQAPARKDLVTIDGDDYEVVNVQQGGQGLSAKLVLVKV